MKSPLSRKRRALWTAAAGLLLAGLVFAAVRVGPLAPMRVTVATVASEPLPLAVYGIGTVEARHSWLLGPTVAGRVLNVHVDVGQPVRAGQLLAEMDPVDLGDRLDAQDAALSKAHSAQSAAQAQLADATARRDLAHTNLRRQADLARQGFISASALEGREQELQSAQAAWNAAQANLQAAGLEARRLQAERAAAARQRQNSRLLAPADAVVTSRDAEPGSTVVAGQPVLRLAHPASLWVKLRVDQGRSAGLAAGLPAKIVLRSRPHQPLSGRVERVELQADAVTEERIAQVAFERVPTGLSIGEMAEVTLELPAAPKAPVVPQASVRTYQGRTGVWRLRDGELDFVPVVWGASSLDGRVQALQGLQPEETVVVYSEKPLSPGVRFRVVDALVKKAAP